MSAAKRLLTQAWRLRLRFPTLALNKSSSVEASSGIAWADPSDHSQQYPLAFYCFRAAFLDAFAADSLDLQDTWNARLYLVDAGGTRFAYYP